MQLMSSVSPTSKPKIVRRRPHDRSEARVSFLPEGNRAAKWAYICLLIGLLPGIGLVTGIAAVILGYFGRQIARRDEHGRGLGHACVSMMLGAFEVVCQGAGWWVLLG
jgi:hypothetical protein